MAPSNLTQSIKSKSCELGFELCGICSAVDSPGFDRFREWIACGYAGEMSYLEAREQAYSHPDSVMKGVRSIVMLGMNYCTESHAPTQTGYGRVAKYAWGSSDYHDLIHQRLKSLKQFILAAEPTARVRGVVDTAPLLERDFAVLAGLGWQAKNTLVINRQLGSWFFLAALLTDQKLESDGPHQTDHCGTCRACLDACPTDAFVGPGVLDASACISYLTIEHRSAVPIEYRKPLGDWLFGCDVCQDVCPWNRKSPVSDKLEYQPREANGQINLMALFELDDDAFRERFRQTPLWRPKRRGILRNAALVLGNQQNPAAIPALKRGLSDHEVLVRGASAWALGQIGGEMALQLLTERLKCESNQRVIEEMELAINVIDDDAIDQHPEP